ncbi:DUF3742 family protein [Pseudomonas sp. KFB-139]|uniref:DUF3742 family protein n=1 Tax=Pseudomonas serbiensis TaxID=3064350 RepID=A0ABT9CQT7_9PSED|nr:DUF3742 family protein [Pseudomonas sp. KFB-138]MDO7927760.1 DUF3742 family protein [Pseudomonas sp. KFB-138]
MTTNTTKQGSFAMRLGQTLGRGAAGMLRMERALWAGVSKAGMPAVVVTALKWAARLGAAVLALWGALYVVPVVVFMAVLIGVANHVSAEDVLNEAMARDNDFYSTNGKPELREGLEGFGTYIRGQRVD